MEKKIKLIMGDEKVCILNGKIETKNNVNGTYGT